MTNVPDYEDFQALIKRIQQLEEEHQFLKSLLTGEQWLTRKQAMNALGCKDNKLRYLTLNNLLTFRYEGKTPFYCVFSVRNYLAANKIDELEIEKRVLRSRYNHTRTQTALRMATARTDKATQHESAES